MCICYWVLKFLYEILKLGQFRIKNYELILQNTAFGFIVSGGKSSEKEKSVSPLWADKTKNKCR